MTPDADPALRLLVACPACERQYDASDRQSGDGFHCACGELLTVPRAEAHDATVVRCSSCGAPREGAAAACSFCDSDFTLHERDLHTICPRCLARISDRARFCHHCALPIAPQGAAGDLTDRTCPACEGEERLVSRGLGGDGLTVLECGRCAGLWLGNEVFRIVAERAQREEISHGGPGAASPAPPSGGSGPLYRPCPSCGQLMHRRNYGRRSGVIVDLCAAHGLWFDHGELERVLAWIRGGGASEVRRLEADEAAEEARRRRYLAGLPSSSPGGMFPSRGRPWVDFVGHLIDLLAR